jgi:hypothetical protein
MVRSAYIQKPSLDRWLGAYHICWIYFFSPFNLDTMNELLKSVSIELTALIKESINIYILLDSRDVFFCLCPNFVKGFLLIIRLARGSPH